MLKLTLRAAVAAPVYRGALFGVKNKKVVCIGGTYELMIYRLLLHLLAGMVMARSAVAAPDYVFRKIIPVYSPITCLSFSPDDKRLAIGTRNKVLVVDSKNLESKSYSQNASLGTGQKSGRSQRISEGGSQALA